ncbi:MAG: hypothetical protein AB7O74_11270 [Candidatus Nanopelagicales bacterium]
MTDGPDDILRGLIEGDSEGPEATPEQEAFVSGLLGSLRRDDPPMPDDVIRRLDAVLAEERRTGSPVLRVIPGGGSDPDGVPASLPDNVSVLPTAAQRRGPSMRSFRVLGGLAAAAVVVVGGATILTNANRGTAGSEAAGGGSPVAASIVRDSGTAYSANTFADQATRLADQADEKGAPPEGGPDGPQPAASAETTDTQSTAEPGVTESASSVDAAPLTPERALLCTKEISDGTVAEPLLVDQGTYNGRDAEVYVLPSLDDPNSYDVIVVAAGCTTGQSELLNFRRVAIP